MSLRFIHTPLGLTPPRPTPTARSVLLVGLTVLWWSLSSCESSTETIVRLNVHYETSWNLDAMELVSQDKREKIPIAPSIAIVVPDEWVENAVTIDVWAYRAEERWAHGSVVARPIRDTEITVDVVLMRLPCGAWCAEGTTRCQGNATAICERRDGDSCLEWSSPKTCPNDMAHCSLGECSSTCIDECAPNETRCDGPTAVQMCGEVDTDECLDWLAPVACSSEETCSLGACRASCVAECTNGTTRCDGGGVSICRDSNRDGCPEWGPPSPCAAPDTCSGGVCSSTCSDECEEKENICDNLNYRQCGEFDGDSCRDLSIGVSCIPDDPCLVGMCNSDGCSNAPRTCEDPPDSLCINPTTLRTYSRTGTCQNGKCSYEYTDQTCSDGCMNGRCGTCVPKTCEELGAECGVVSDGCNNVIRCAPCLGNTACGADGRPNICAPAVVSACKTVGCPSGFRYLDMYEDEAPCPDSGESCPDKYICLAEGITSYSLQESSSCPVGMHLADSFYYACYVFRYSRVCVPD